MEEGAIPFFHLIGRNQGPTAITVAGSQNHALVKEFLEGFLGWHDTDIIEEFVPKTGIEEVKNGVFGTADIDVDRQPLFEQVFIRQFLIVVGVDVAQVVPAGASPLRHGVGFPAALDPIFAHHFQPVCQIGQWRLTRS